ncbi:MAG: VPLPA-CTERM sorting domain-containing protein, partial [Pikeienuella sp.]
QVPGRDLGQDNFVVGSAGDFDEILNAEAVVEDGDTVSLSAGLDIAAGAFCTQTGCGTATVDVLNTLQLFLATPLPEGATLAPQAGDQAESFVLPDRLSVVPLPASAWLLMSGLAGIAVLRRRRTA